MGKREEARVAAIEAVENELLALGYRGAADRVARRKAVLRAASGSTVYAEQWGVNLRTLRAALNALLRETYL